MDRRDFLVSTTSGGVSFLLPGCFKSKANMEKPNILLIMADDMGFSDLGCYGSVIQTPHLNRLAAEGMRFSQFYNAARCCPTRASLLTGLYPHQAGIGDMVDSPGSSEPGPYQGYLNDRSVTIAEVMKSAGYNTMMSGKWHVGEDRPHWPTDRGFDKYFGLISGAANYFDIRKGKSEGIKRQMALDDQPYDPPKEGFYMTDAITDHAVNCLDTLGRKDKPFFQYVAYTAPHWPLHALPKDIRKYRGKYLKGWDVLRRDRYQRLVEMGILKAEFSLAPPDDEVVAWKSVKNKNAMDLKMAIYAAQIDRMDQGIGKILNKLKEIGKKKNTLVFFLSDNGGCHEGGPLGFDRRENGLPPGGVDSYMSYGRGWANASNTPFRMYKHWVHEGGIATPLIVRWPEVIKKGGLISNQVGHIVDIMSTCCQVAGIPYPQSFNEKNIQAPEGLSLIPIFRGRKRKGHDVLCWEHEGNKALRQGEWKLVSKDKGKWELYNLEDDRAELNDLSSDRIDQIKVLEAKYISWAERCGVRIRDMN